MQAQQGQENYESSPRNMTIEQINNNYQTNKQQVDAFNLQQLVNRQTLTNQKYQNSLYQYNQNYHIKVNNLKTDLQQLENDIKSELEKENRVFNIQNQQSIQYLDQISYQYQEIQKLETAIKTKYPSNHTTDPHKPITSKLIAELDTLQQGNIEPNQQKIQFQLNLEDIDQQPQNNLEYFQKLEKQVSQIEQILGIDSKDLQNVKINDELQQNLVDLEAIDLDDQKVNRMQELTEEIEELEKKRTEIKFRDKDLQMIQDIWENYQNYQTVQNYILPIKQRLEMLKKIHEESDSINKTIANLKQANQDLEKNVKKVKGDLENQQKEYQKQFQNIEQEVSKMEKNIKI